MIPIPKPKFFERKIPSGQSKDDFFEAICARQTHDLCNAIERVSSCYLAINILLNLKSGVQKNYDFLIFTDRVYFDCHNIGLARSNCIFLSLRGQGDHRNFIFVRKSSCNRRKNSTARIKFSRSS